jgi:subtilase family serine protease
MRLMKAFPLSVFSVLAGALLCAAALLCGPFLSAQNSSVAQRITTDVNELSLATLKGNVPRMAQAEFDQGEAEPSTPLTHMRLVLSRSAEQQAALDSYLALLQDKSSPNYHKWLTPEQFGQLYGPADSDIAALVAWLQSHGLQVETVSKGRTNIAFNGTVSQAEEAFHTSIHSFQAGEDQFTSNTTDPQIPSALVAVVKGVAHLNTIRPRPHSVRTSVGNAETSRMAAGNGPRPNLTSTYNGDFLYITPADAATIYNTPNAFNLNNTSSTSYTGSGVKIGIGGAATISASIVGTYRSTFLGSAYATAPTLYYCTSSTSCSSTPDSPVCTGKQTSGCYDNTDDADEAYLDTELSGAMAPGATIYYYASTDLTAGIEAAIEGNINGVTPDIFSLSFGECESDMVSDGSLSLINGYWEQAAGEGIAVTVSSGDSGSASCDGDTAKVSTVAKLGLSVSGYASTIYNIAVGGTDFYGLESGFTSYVSTSSIGSSSTYYRTVSSYIPETIWNDSIADDTTQITANVPETGKYASIVAGSGGASIEYSRPSWQTASTGTFDSNSKRDIPDVSLMSGNGYDSATWLVCDGDTRTLAFSSSTGVLNCSSISGGYFDGFGGTSTAAPAFAGILALVQQKTGSRLGQAAQTLYSLYNGTHGSAIFHDVTVGNNSVPCTSGSSKCSLNSLSHYFLTGYNASSGYDMASGLGSVNATQLVNYWSGSTGTATPTVRVTVNTTQPVTTGEAVSVTVAVSGSSSSETYPTGTVTLAGGGYSSSSESLSSGSYTFSIPAGSLAIGTDTLTASYSGDSVYAATTNSSTSVTVTGSSSSATFNLSATSPSSIAPGASTTSTITVSSSTFYSGTVTLTCALTNPPSGATYLPSCSNGSNTLTLSSGVVTGTASATITVYTTPATSELLYPKLPGSGWAGAGGGAVLAFLVFLGIPARRRSWRSMLGILIVMTALGSLAACGGSTPSGGTTGTTGTTAGAYTFTVTGTGNPTVNPAATTTFTVTVT